LISRNFAEVKSKDTYTIKLDGKEATLVRGKHYYTQW